MKKEDWVAWARILVAHSSANAKMSTAMWAHREHAFPHSEVSVFGIALGNIIVARVQRCNIIDVARETVFGILSSGSWTNIQSRIGKRSICDASVATCAGSAKCYGSE
jgi:hypothetical protein